MQLSDKSNHRQRRHRSRDYDDSKKGQQKFQILLETRPKSETLLTCFVQRQNFHPDSPGRHTQVPVLMAVQFFRSGRESCAILSSDLCPLQRVEAELEKIDQLKCLDDLLRQLLAHWMYAVIKLTPNGSRADRIHPYTLLQQLVR